MGGILPGRVDEGMSLTEAQLDVRRTRVSASDTGAIIGVSPYASPWDVWGQKTGRLPGFAGNLATRVGNALEASVLSLAAEVAAERELVAEYPWVSQPGTLTYNSSWGEEWACATPDALWRAGARTVNVQCKVVGIHAASKWGREEDGPDGIPPYYLSQIDWEMWVAGSHQEITSSWCVALLGTEMRFYRIMRDAKREAALVAKCRSFWERCIRDGLEPSRVDDSDACARLCSELYRPATSALKNRVEATPEQARAIYDYLQSSSLAKLAESQKKSARAELTRALGKTPAGTTVIAHPWGQCAVVAGPDGSARLTVTHTKGDER